MIGFLGKNFFFFFFFVKRKSQIVLHSENGLPMFSKLNKNEVLMKKYQVLKDPANKAWGKKTSREKKASSF